MQSDDRLDMMTLFVRISDTGRLAEAGRQLGLSPAAASRMLRRLETILNVELVKRSTKGLVLTEAGQRFAAMARSMLDQWRDAAESLDEDAANLRGPLRILAPVAIGQNLLTSIFSAFVKSHPGVTIECDLKDETVDLPAMGYDLQIRAGPVLHQSLVVRELWQIARTIVAARGHACVSHPGELAEQPSVRLTTFVPATIELHHRDSTTATLRHRSVFATDNLFAALTAVRDGLGFAVLPCWATQRDIEAGALMQLCPDWHPPNVVLSLVYPPNRLRPKRLEALLRVLRHELTAEAGLGIAFLAERGARETVKFSATPRPRTA